MQSDVTGFSTAACRSSSLAASALTTESRGSLGIFPL